MSKIENGDTSSPQKSDKDPIEEDVTSPSRKKRHHVSFADEVKLELVDLHHIESYKKYNSMDFP